MGEDRNRARQRQAASEHRHQGSMGRLESVSSSLEGTGRDDRGGAGTGQQSVGISGGRSAKVAYAGGYLGV